MKMVGILILIWFLGEGVIIHFRLQGIFGWKGMDRIFCDSGKYVISGFLLLF